MCKNEALFLLKQVVWAVTTVFLKSDKSTEAGPCVWHISGFNATQNYWITEEALYKYYDFISCHTVDIKQAFT
jgi:hypothetical protein